jgi:hypothetical protein
LVSATLTGLTPARVLPGARLALVGHDLPVSSTDLSTGSAAAITIDGASARVVFASSTRTIVEVPSGLEGGAMDVHVAACPETTLVVSVGRQVATGLHQVDSPVCDAAGRLYVTYSGARGQAVPISIFRILPGEVREPFVSGIPNPTSLAIGPDGLLYVSSRFEGAVYRVFEDGRYEVAAAELGVACGLAFGADGALHVGDRSGTLFRLDFSRDGGSDRAFRLATLPSSIAAFHLAMSPDGWLHVTAPTLAPRDHVYRISANGNVEALGITFGRPQGLAFDAHGTLHVVEALAGAGGIYRWREGGEAELVVAGPNIVGLTFTPDEAMVVATSDALYRFDKLIAE